ncbi:DgyrCDS874 [Dimorphilus gyrociliatus]|uniref:DgyrCDS874 n=1 Tax=Dimorphilus gyrociliatus TaxID=2664684 RepID=A0A7I8V8P6_9ANNE|nr:DgyrCDS874 [Dimorphilus gyrociliatus]
METFDKRNRCYTTGDHLSYWKYTQPPAMTDFSSASSTISSDYGSWITAPSETGNFNETCLSLSVRFKVEKCDKEKVKSLYEPIFSLIDENSDLFTFDDSDNGEKSIKDQIPSVTVSSLALMVFHKENYVTEKQQSVKMVKECLKKPPWVLHHTDSTTRGSIHPYPFNNLDYYSCSSNLPLLALRQVHYGKEIIRIVRFVSHKNWQDQINFYSLVIAQNATIIRNDFCLFILKSTKNTKFQLHFALKKAPDKVKVSKVNDCSVQFSVDKIGHLVPLLPKTANQISENLWLSNDLDDNEILFSTVAGSTWSSRISLSHVSASVDHVSRGENNDDDDDDDNDNEPGRRGIDRKDYETASVLSKTPSSISITQSELSTLCHHIEPKRPVKLTKTLVRSIRDSREQMKRIREGDSGVDSPNRAPSTARSLTPCSATSSKCSDKLSPRVFLNEPSQKVVQGLKGFYV